MKDPDSLVRRCDAVDRGRLVGGPPQQSPRRGASLPSPRCTRRHDGQGPLREVLRLIPALPSLASAAPPLAALSPSSARGRPLCPVGTKLRAGCSGDHAVDNNVGGEAKPLVAIAGDRLSGVVSDEREPFGR